MRGGGGSPLQGLEFSFLINPGLVSPGLSSCAPLGHWIHMESICSERSKWMAELPMGERGHMVGIWHPCQGARFIVGFPGATHSVAPGYYLRPFQGLGMGVLGHHASSSIRVIRVICG